jgi:hypothetical protein
VNVNGLGATAIVVGAGGNGGAGVGSGGSAATGSAGTFYQYGSNPTRMPPRRETAIATGSTTFSIETALVEGANNELNIIGQFVGIRENVYGDPRLRVVDTRERAIGIIVGMSMNPAINGANIHYLSIRTFDGPIQ